MSECTILPFTNLYKWYFTKNKVNFENIYKKRCNRLPSKRSPIEWEASSWSNEIPYHMNFLG